MTTPLVTPPAFSDADDTPAIVELRRVHAAKRAAFLADPYPEAAERKAHLAALAQMMLAHRRDIEAAMSEDFGVHPELFTDLVEVLGVAARAAYAAQQLDGWMAEEERPLRLELGDITGVDRRLQRLGAAVGEVLAASASRSLAAGHNRAAMTRWPACGRESCSPGLQLTRQVWRCKSVLVPEHRI